MTRRVRVNPIFYNRLTWAVEQLPDGLGYEVEFIARHLDEIKDTFANRWDEQLDAPGLTQAKLVIGAMGDDSEVIFAVTGRLFEDDWIEIRNIVIVARP